ncbi:hypothetical protein G5B39_10920 [Rhodobacteraceae bacterium SC52]|nr:hypothetical protein G5B39_10920 [Rhodobacteraceae bacterium SC52]
MRAITLCLMLFLPTLVQGQARPGSDAVLDAMQIEDLFEVMQEEAIVSGMGLVETMMPGRDLSGWRLTLTRLNAPSRMLPDFRTNFAEALPEDQEDAVLDYLTSPRGQRIVDLELSARVALNEPDIQDIVLERFEQMQRDNDPRADVLTKFIDVNDLVEANVLGALNANAAFLQGLRSGEDVPGFLGGGDILAEVWAQEPEIRSSTQDWLNAFVSLAYRPLSDEELQRHIAFSESMAGQAMNDALFAAFDVTFTQLSLDTGTALARLMGSEDL